MKMISYFIAWRYIIRPTHEGSISTMTLISFLGIFIGSFSLALVTAIMHGFDIATHEKMQGIHAQATLHAYGEPLNVDALNPVLSKEFTEISAWAPSSTSHALAQSDNEQSPDAPTVIMLKAIDPDLEIHVSTLQKKVLLDAHIDTIQKNNVFIGSNLAETLHISQGDSIQLLYTDGTSQKGRSVSFKTYNVTVAGFIKTGIDEFDSSMVLCSFDLFEKLFPTLGVQELHLKFVPSSNEHDAFEHIRNRFDLGIYSWKDLYPAIVSALKLEKYVCFFVLGLISLVASMNIISLLFMIIADKRSDIAILKALGARNSDVIYIFLLLSVGITFIASAIGVASAILASWLLEHYPFIELPDVYYVSHLPSRMTWQIPCIVMLLSLIMCILATLIPVKKIRSLSIARTLRFEG